jgi:hypothetical protein
MLIIILLSAPSQPCLLPNLKEGRREGWWVSEWVSERGWIHFPSNFWEPEDPSALLLFRQLPARPPARVFVLLTQVNSRSTPVQATVPMMSGFFSIQPTT